MMKPLDIPNKTPKKPKRINFNISIEVQKKLTALRNTNNVSNGELFEYMVNYFYDKSNKDGANEFNQKSIDELVLKTTEAILKEIK